MVPIDQWHQISATCMVQSISEHNPMTTFYQNFTCSSFW
jgi:hypothetical protein